MKSFELLNFILSEDEGTTEAFFEFLPRSTEDQYIEYKDGKDLNKENNPAEMVREYISAFANSDGGILAIGIEDKTLKLTGCKAPGGGDLREWASRALTPIAPFLSPKPKINILINQNNYVLLIAVPRSFGLVPCNIKGEVKYFFRLHDQTLLAPEYLIKDLLLDRRKRPNLLIQSHKFINIHPLIDKTEKTIVQFVPAITISIENQSLVWADNSRHGFITCSPNNQNKDFFISSHLLGYIELYRPKTELFIPIFRHRSEVFHTIDPFEKNEVSCNYGLPAIYKDGYMIDLTYKFAFYLIAREMQPVWYQINIKVDRFFKDASLRSDGTTEDLSGFVEIYRTEYEKPVVGIFINE